MKTVDYSLRVVPNYDGQGGAIDYSASEWFQRGVVDLPASIDDVTYLGRSCTKFTSDNGAGYEAAALDFPTVPDESILSCWMSLEDSGLVRGGFWGGSATEAIIGVWAEATLIGPWYTNTSDDPILITITPAVTTHMGGWLHIEMRFKTSTNTASWYYDGQLVATVYDWKGWSTVIELYTQVYQNDAWLSGICLNGKPLENYQLGQISADDFVEQSAIVKEANLDDILVLDIDNHLDKSQFPMEIRKMDDGLGLGEQVRWLQRALKEENETFMALYDGLLEQHQLNIEKIEELEDLV